MTRTAMSAIIVEGVLFVALIVTGATLLYFVLVQLRPFDR